MRWRTWSRMVLVALVGVLALSVVTTSVSLAAEVSGTGRLQATGVGGVRINGDGTVVIGRGAGTVWVTGADEIVTEGQGRRTVLPDGTVRLTGYSGAITISGDVMRVRILGGSIDVTATGSGEVLLKGYGTFETNAGSGNWTPQGVTINF